MKVYLTGKLTGLDQKGWLRRQPAEIDRVIGSIDVLGHGVEDGIAWVEVPGEAEVIKISQVLSCETEKPVADTVVPSDIEKKLIDIQQELSALRSAFETANVIAAKEA